MIRSVVRYILLAAAKILFRARAVGRKNIPESGGVLIASNHVSYLDPPLLGVAIPRRVSFMAKAELFRNAFMDGLFRRLDAFPVSRTRVDRRAIQEAVHRIGRGEALVMFPEGTVSFNDEFLPPKFGIGMIVSRTWAPVVPAYICGSENALPPDNSRFRPARVVIYFGAAMDFSKYRNEPKGRKLYMRISAEIMEQIGRLKQKEKGMRQEQRAPER